MMPAPIAIDGPAASGKSTLGRILALRLGYLFLDTGAMYRAFTLAAMRAGVPSSDQAACERLAERLDLDAKSVDGETRVYIEGSDVTDQLRAAEVEANVSQYSAIPGVRRALVRQQRAIAAAGPAILAGRDIGTVVLPNAPVKLYLDAAPEVRSARRGVQAGQRAEEARHDIVSRDTVDRSRAVSPLRPADDAKVIDTTGRTIEDVVELAMECLRCATV